MVEEVAEPLEKVTAQALVKMVGVTLVKMVAKAIVEMFAAVPKENISEILLKKVPEAPHLLHIDDNPHDYNSNRDI